MRTLEYHQFQECQRAAPEKGRTEQKGGRQFDAALEAFLLAHGRDATVPYARLHRMVLDQFGDAYGLTYRDLVRFFKSRGGKPKATKMDRDPELAAWARARAGSMPIAALHLALIESFGCDRAPSLGVLSRYLRRFLGPVAIRKARTTRIETDAALRDWLLAETCREGDPLTLDQLYARCVALFGAQRAPSRATLGRARTRFRRQAAAPRP